MLLVSNGQENKPLSTSVEAVIGDLLLILSLVFEFLSVEWSTVEADSNVRVEKLEQVLKAGES